MFCPGCGSNLGEDAKFCTNCGMALAENVQTEGNEVKKSGVLKKSVIGVIAVIVIVGVIAAVTALFSNLLSGSSEAIAYVKKDKLYYKEKIKNNKDAYEITRLYSDSEYIPIEFSEDGKYLYFFTDVDDYSSGTLNRIEVKKIKADSEKNEKNILEIASDVEIYGYQFVGEKGLIYKCKNGKIMYFDGKEEYKIAKNCAQFIYDKEKNTLVYSVLTDEDAYRYSIYAGKFDKDMNAEKIDTDISMIQSMKNPEFIIYTKTNDDSSELYVAGIEQEPVKISENYYSLGAINEEQKKMIFIENKEISRTLYEFVEDDFKDADEEVVEPDATKYMSEVSLSEVLDEDSYEYYKEYPEDLTYFYEYLWEDDVVGMKYYTNWDTDKTYYYDGIKWYSLDEDLYQRAWEEFDKHSDRIYLRSSLQEEQYTETVESAYYYEAGKEIETLIEDVKNIVVADAETKVFTYQTASYDKMKLSELEEIWSLREDIEANRIWTSYCSVANGNSVEIGDETVYFIEMSEDKTKCAMKAFDQEKYEILICNVNGKEISLEEPLTKHESGAIGTWKENTFYYVADIEESSGILYSYKNGKSSEMLKDIPTDSIILYDDNSYMTYEYDLDGAYDIQIYGENNKRIEKFSDVDGIPTYINDKCILLIRRDKLCLYDGSDELKEIDRNVTSYSVNEEPIGATYIY